MTNKTTLTPSEHANNTQGIQYLDSLRAFIDDTGEASDVIAVKVVREKLAIVEVVVRAGVAGSASATQIDVKKNATSVIAALLTIDNADADGTIVVGVPDTDTLGQLEPGDVLTINTGTVATNLEDLSVEVRLAKRFDIAPNG